MNTCTATYGFDNLDAFFEKQYLSHEIGMHKPDRKPFDLILMRTAWLPEEDALFIDDSQQHLGRCTGSRH
jgi:glucose-1-phosphatase